MAAMHSDVASAIGQQVEQMILKAKKDSENRVRHDITAAKNQLQQMQTAVAELSDRVQRCAWNNGPKSGGNSQIVDKASLTQNIAQLEEKWGAEVKALKQDLHRTILAHNHNSDLMRAHRDALDEARRKLDTLVQPKVSDVDAHIEKLDRMLRASSVKQKAVDLLCERLAGLEQHCQELLPGAGLSGGFSPMMPGMGAGMGMTPPVAQAKRAGAKKGEAVTEEDVRAKLMAAAKANPANEAPGTQFNAQAPVFVPGGAATGAATFVNLENAIHDDEAADADAFEDAEDAGDDGAFGDDVGEDEVEGDAEEAPEDP